MLTLIVYPTRKDIEFENLTIFPTSKGTKY